MCGETMGNDNFHEMGIQNEYGKNNKNCEGVRRQVDACKREIKGKQMGHSTSTIGVDPTLCVRAWRTRRPFARAAARELVARSGGLRERRRASRMWTNLGASVAFFRDAPDITPPEPVWPSPAKPTWAPMKPSSAKNDAPEAPMFVKLRSLRAHGRHCERSLLRTWGDP